MSSSSGNMDLTPSEFRDKLTAQIEKGNLIHHQIRSAADLFAILVHTCISSLAHFNLVAVSDQDTQNEHACLACLPQGWNSSADTYVFKYVSSLAGAPDVVLLVKLVTLGSFLIGHALTDNLHPSHHAFLPSTLIVPTANFPVESGSTVNSLLTPNDALVASFLGQVKHLVFPSLIKSHHSHGPGPDSKPDNGANPNLTDPTTHSKHGQYPPAPSVQPMRGFVSPYSIGHSDLDPLGGMPPIAGRPFGQHPGQPGPFNDGGGGNYMGPNHPMFTSPRGNDFGGNQHFPPGSVPPGARFDPVLPVRPPHGPYSHSGEPDNDMFMPPGMGGFPGRGRGGREGFPGNMFM